MRYFLVILSLIFVMSCGGSSGGGSSADLSCAPDEDDLLTPTVSLDGTWNLYLDYVSTDGCSYAPSWISCPLTMSVSTNTVTITGSCTSNTGAEVNIGSMPGIISADDLYWGATMTGGEGTYSETDTVPCTSVEFTSATQSEEFRVIVSVAWTDSGESGTCTVTFDGDFTSTS